MMSYLEIVVHAVVAQLNKNIKLQSFLLSCKRSSGPHPSQRIAAALDQIKLAEINKIDFIIS